MIGEIQIDYISLLLFTKLVQFLNTTVVEQQLQKIEVLDQLWLHKGSTNDATEVFRKLVITDIDDELVHGTLELRNAFAKSST